MIEHTEFYYLFSTIPQVLAAFLGLSSIFLIYCYTQIKQEIVTVAEKLFELTRRYNGNREFDKLRNSLRSGVSIRSTKFILKSINELFTNPKFDEIIQKAIEKQEVKFEKDKMILEKNVLLKESSKFIEALKVSSQKINCYARWSFYLGIPSIIISFSIIPLIPKLIDLALFIVSSILSLGAILSIVFMILLIFDYINRSKREFII